MTTSFSELNEVRQVARARAQEDFAYFANTVLAARMDVELCDIIQRRVERGLPCESLNGKQHVLDAWLSVLGRKTKLVSSPTDTFTWLFADHLERAA